MAVSDLSIKTNTTVYKGIKRAFDLAGAMTLLVLTSPVSIAAAVIIRTESSGSVFFDHKRAGLNGNIIYIHKFRSMREGSENLEAVLNDEELEKYYREFKLHDDPRITRTGRLLRKTSMDELPQLVNVLAGSMSLVGPRPVTEEELSYYDEEDRKKLLSVKPGLTGLWQISDRSRSTYQSGSRQRTELFYVEHASLLMDAVILLLTPAAVLKRALS